MMAMELFRPFIVGWLHRKLRLSRRAAEPDHKRKTPQAFAVLEAVLPDVVLINRAPTLHRLSMQGFRPVLVDGKAIRLSPMACAGFNADFDGDQMAVHVPLSRRAVLEVKDRMSGTACALSPATGRPVYQPTQEAILGLYYATQSRAGATGEGMCLSGPNEARFAWESGAADLHARVTARVHGTIHRDTTIGRVLLSDCIQKRLPYAQYDKQLDRGAVEELLVACHQQLGRAAMLSLADQLRRFGQQHATRAGISFCIDDLPEPPVHERAEVLQKARERCADLDERSSAGDISAEVHTARTAETLTDATRVVQAEWMNTLAEETAASNPLHMMWDSGARGKQAHFEQLGAMRGLFRSVRSGLILDPVVHSLREGQTTFEFFAASYGARFGVMQTAHLTATEGYLGRKLHLAMADVLVTQRDCGATNGIRRPVVPSGGALVLGRNLVRPKDDGSDATTGDTLWADAVELLLARGIEGVEIRSPLTCRAADGVCALCYGLDPGSGLEVEVGHAVGVIAAQSVSEPATQGVLSAFHEGGVGGAEDCLNEVQIRAGRAGVVRWDTARAARRSSADSRFVRWVVLNRAGVELVTNSGEATDTAHIPYGAFVLIEDGQQVATGQILATHEPNTVRVLAPEDGTIRWANLEENANVFHCGERHYRVTGSQAAGPPKISIVSFGSTATPLSDRTNEVELSRGWRLFRRDGEEVARGDLIAEFRPTPPDIPTRQKVLHHPELFSEEGTTSTEAAIPPSVRIVVGFIEREEPHHGE